ncbi:MAG: glutamyl-tRNA reductase [Bacteroidota bacterium]
MESFYALSLSHVNASLPSRELVSFNLEEAGEFLLRLKDVVGASEALVVSTCNRTEIYYHSGVNHNAEILRVLASFKAINISEVEKKFVLYQDRKAVEHLFRVALGLESKVLGDIQVSNQIKKAYQQSADLNLAGPFLHRLLHTIFFANKRVVQETQLQDGTASVASVASDLTGRFSEKFSAPKVALLGTGEIGQNVLENLEGRGLQITLVNRTKSRAERLAKNTDIIVKDFDHIPEVVAENDIIISAASSDDFLIDDSHLKNDGLHKMLIDLAVPRSIDSVVGSLKGISLVNLDELSEKTLQAKERRQKAVPDVEMIIAEAVEGFGSWQAEMEVSPTIQKLKDTLNQIRSEELARHSKLSESERELLDVVTKNMIQKVIKLPAIQLKAACKRGDAENLAGVLKDLFNLEAQEPEKQ